MLMLRNAAVAVFFLWTLVDGALVFRHKTAAAENRDRHSLRLIVVGNLTAWALGIGLAYGAFGGMRPAVPLQIAGFILMGAGIALRSAAILQLGRFHTPNVAVLQDHRVIDTDLYRHVRHPSYLGALIAFLGFSLALVNGLSLGIIMGVALVIYGTSEQVHPGLVRGRRVRRRSGLGYAASSICVLDARQAIRCRASIERARFRQRPSGPHASGGVAPLKRIGVAPLIAPTRARSET